jgi:hypothetical protein
LSNRKVSTKVVGNTTVAMQSIYRIPAEELHAVLRMPGMTDDRVFIRPFLTADVAKDSEHNHKVDTVNLWLGTSKWTEAKQKCDAMPADHALGLSWEAKGFGVRVMREFAAAAAPLLTGRDWMEGEKYEIAGIPRDSWHDEDLFKALNEMDVPWTNILQAKVLFKKMQGGCERWTIKASHPPPAVQILLDNVVLRAKKAEPRRTPVKQPLPKPVPAPWCSSKELPPHGADNLADDKKDQDATMEAARVSETRLGTREGSPRPPPPKRQMTGHAPEGAQAAGASAAGSSPAPAPTQPDVMQALLAQMAEMSKQLAQLVKANAELEARIAAAEAAKKD